MKTKSIVQFVVLLIASARLAGAADNLNEALQKGLLEEEANHNLDAAIQAYQTVLNQFDDQRKITATAVFRLGECYRKLGKTNDAVAQYQRVGRDFADQESLAKLSAQNLSALGTSASSFQQRLQQILPQSGLDVEAMEIQRYRDLAQNSPDLLNAENSGNTPLLNAAGENQLAVANFLIQQGADLNRRVAGGDTPLLRAVRSGHKAMAELLLNHQADVNARTDLGVTPLHEAASKGFLAIADVLLAHGADPNAEMKDGAIAPWTQSSRYYFGATPLHYAAASGYLAVVKLLLEQKADVNAKTVTGRTPLCAAADFNRLEVVKLLLAHQADPNLTASDGTPLGTAVRNQNVEMVKALLAAWANVNAKGVPVDSNPMARNPGNILVPLAFAARLGNLEMARLLLQNKAGINVQDDLGYTPLRWAVGVLNAEMVKLLLERGADPDIKDKQGNVPFSIWASGDERNEKAKEIDELLLAHKLNVNATNETGRTLLSGAAEYGNREMVELLLKHGADVNVADNIGATPLHWAAYSQDKHSIELLISHKADLNARDKTGKTPLGWIRSPSVIRSQRPPVYQPGTIPNQQENDLAALLLQHGAKE